MALLSSYDFNITEIIFIIGNNILWASRKFSLGNLIYCPISRLRYLDVARSRAVIKEMTSDYTTQI